MPNAPTALTAAPTTRPGEVELRWQDNSRGELWFGIYRSTDGTTWTRDGYAEANQTRYVADDLAAGTTYYFKVRAEHFADSEFTPAVHATPAPRGAPYGLEVTGATDVSVSLRWFETGGDTTAYVIERSSDGVVYYPAGTVTADDGRAWAEFTATSLTPGTAYRFRVRATGPGGSSVFTDPIRGTTAVVAAPSGLRVTPFSTSQVRLTWDDQSSNETGFRVEASTDGETFEEVATAAPGQTTRDVDGLLPGTTYVFRVVATAAAGASDPSDLARGRTLPTDARAYRTNVGFAANTLAWDADGNTEDGASDRIDLPFTVDLFGRSFTGLFVNENGTISFVDADRRYYPSAMADQTAPLLAPFFADVTRTNRISGDVTWGTDVVDGRAAFGIDWYDVDHYSAEQGESSNRFQVVLVDRSDRRPGDFDIEFNYDHVRWESGGWGGLGGDVARVGFASGAGQAGTYYEFPGSGEEGALLDSNADTGLSGHSLNSSVLGRYRFEIRNGVDLVVDGVPDAQEITRGGFVPLNDDFDEANRAGFLPLPDNQGTPGIVAGDNELRRATLTLGSLGRVGKWALDFDDQIRVWWQHDDGTFTQVMAGVESAEMTVGAPMTLWIEGVRASESAADVELRATFTPTGETLPRFDPVRLTVVALRAGVDNDRDGQLDLSGRADATSRGNSYGFWLNDDHDAEEDSSELPVSGLSDPAVTRVEGDSQGAPDSSDGVIAWKRDLEDFTRFQIGLPGYVDLSETDAAGQPVWSVRLQFIDTQGTAPSVRLFPAVDGTEAYLRDLTAAQAQLTLAAGGASYLVAGAGEVAIPLSLFAANGARSIAPFIFEGVTAGRGAIVVRFYRGGAAVGETKTYLDLRPVQQMYDHYTSDFAADYDFGPGVLNGNPATGLVGSSAYDDFSRDDREYIVFVHGWNVDPFMRVRFADTAFKRLYWQGYHGRFGAFTWNAQYTGGRDYDTQNFDRSELEAWRAAAPLRALLTRLNQQYPGEVSVMAHSQGNIVTSEALRLEAERTDAPPVRIVKTYVAMQAASPAEAYDPSVPNQDFAGTLTVPDLYRLNGGYFRNLNLAAGNLVNFYNESDFALQPLLYEANQLTKPDGWLFGTTGSGYVYDAANNVFIKRFQTSQTNVVLTWLDWETNLADRYEVFAHAAPVYSRALGTGPVASFDDNINAKAEFGFTRLHRYHSAGFMMTNMDVDAYWRRVLGKIEGPAPR
jgi:hypothetical protein